MAPAACLEPAISHACDSFSDRCRIQDGLRRNKQKRFPGAVVVCQRDTADTVQLFKHGNCAVEMFAELLAGPGFFAQSRAGMGGRPGQPCIENDGLDALAARVGRRLGAEQPAADDQEHSTLLRNPIGFRSAYVAVSHRRTSTAASSTILQSVYRTVTCPRI